MIGVWIAIGVLVVIVLWVIAAYNSMVAARQQTKNAWSQIDVQLKRRYDLIPNLVETAKGYLKHERETLEAVIRARQVAIDAGGKGVQEQIRAENQLTQTLRSLFAVSEAYPDLKANQNMLSLQEELTSTENRIGFARQAYNDAVMRYNSMIESFPQNMIRGIGNFTQAAFWEVEDASERKPVQVKF
jgi:LemA protein